MRGRPKNDSLQRIDNGTLLAMLAAARAEIAEPFRWREWGLETGEKRARPDEPSARRLCALIEVLGFEGLGAQVRFAEEIGVGRKRLNNVLVGYPLSQKLAQKIIGRYPQVSTDFLLLGRSGGNLDRKLERRLSDYQRRTGISVFTSPA